jgi:hypothetical protein
VVGVARVRLPYLFEPGVCQLVEAAREDRDVGAQVAPLRRGRDEVVSVGLERERVPGGEPRIALRLDRLEQLVGVRARAPERVDLAERDVRADEAEEEFAELQ